MIWTFPQPINPGEVGPEIIIEAHVDGPECLISNNHVIANFTCAHGIMVENEDYAYIHAYKKGRDINTPLLNLLEYLINQFPILKALFGL